MDSRFYAIKPPSDRDERMLELLRQPHVANKVDAVAKHLNNVFNNHAKIMANIRPEARFRNTVSGQIYAYEGVVVPFDHDDMVRLTLQEAKRPVEELSDQGYFIFRTVVPGSKTDIVLTDKAGERFTMEGKAFIAYFAIGVFEILDMNNTDEKTLIEKSWRPTKG